VDQRLSGGGESEVGETTTPDWGKKRECQESWARERRTSTGEVGCKRKQFEEARPKERVSKEEKGGGKRHVAAQLKRENGD